MDAISRAMSMIRTILAKKRAADEEIGDAPLGKGEALRVLYQIGDDPFWTDWYMYRQECLEEPPQSGIVYFVLAYHPGFLAKRIRRYEAAERRGDSRGAYPRFSLRQEPKGIWWLNQNCGNYRMQIVWSTRQLPMKP